MNIRTGVECSGCGKVVTIECDHMDFLRWRNGGQLIQNVMPYLTADEREILISNTCGDCWNDLFGEY